MQEVMKIRKAVNIKEVARHANVSQACVSKYLNKRPYVSKQTANKIQDAIDALNYSPSEIARSLVKRKTNNIGLLILDIKNPYQTEVIRGIENYKNAKNLDYNLLLIDMLQNEKSGDKYIDSFIQNRVNGILTTSDRISKESLKNLKALGIPIIFIGRFLSFADVEVDYVTSNNDKGSYIMTNYLLGLGHRKITFITPQVDSTVISLRIRGYKNAIKDFRDEEVGEDIFYGEDFTFNSGFKAAEKIFSKTERPTAIFCINDYSAYGVIDYCLSKGIKIPYDISIAGFDDIQFSSLGLINLTTVRQPIEEIGRLAAEALSKKLETGDNKRIKIVLEPELVIRNSTRGLI
ncbi:MAG: LacI family transcriptional regulator [Actinobacteria bacterium]|nr:LacI family transcriptional regulator [Actinomycetota bacterium]